MNGTWEGLNAALRECLRLRLGRHAHPSAGVVDSSQSAKTTGVGGEQRGYDGGKKVVRGRKRHLLVDTEGLVLKARVHSAKVPDQDRIRLLLESARSQIPRLRHVWLEIRVTRGGASAGPKKFSASMLRSRPPSSKAGPRGGGEEVGGGVGQGGQGEGRLAAADAAARVRSFASPMGGGTHLRLVRPEQADE